MNQTEAAEKLGISKDRLSFLKNKGVANLRDIKAIERETDFTFDDVRIHGAWYCIKNGLSVIDGRKK